LKRVLQSISPFFFAVLLGLNGLGCPRGSQGACAEGDHKDAVDGCNSCECVDGGWQCTEMACPTPDVARDAGAEEPEQEKVDAGPSIHADAGTARPEKQDGGAGAIIEWDAGPLASFQTDAGHTPHVHFDAGQFASPNIDSGMHALTPMDAGTDEATVVDAGSSLPIATDGGTSSLPLCTPVNFNVGPPNYDCSPNITPWPPSIDDVAYGDDPLQKMDIYIPDTSDTLPLLIWIHGGGWKGGKKHPFPCFIWAITQGEYVVVSVNYRLTIGNIVEGTNEVSLGVPWPAQVADVKQAVRFLRANAANYQIQPDNIGVIGSSAGGHLSAIMGLAGDDDWLRGDALALPEQSDAVQAAVDMYGPTRPDLMDQQLEALGICVEPQCHDCNTSPEYTLLDCHGVGLESCNIPTTKMSPITYVDASDPPMIVAHGDADCSVPPQQSQLLANRLALHGVEHEFILVPGAGHQKNPVAQGIGLSKLQQFFDEHLRGCKRP